MDNQTVQNRPVAAFALSLVSGITGIIAAVVLILIGAIAYSETISYYYSSSSLSTAYLFGGWGAWMIVCSIISIVAGVKLNSDPMGHTKWGILVLVFSILMPVNPFGIIGGALGIAFKPITEVAPSTYKYQPINRICPQCGHVIDESVRFCPHCGKQLF